MSDKPHGPTSVSLTQGTAGSGYAGGSAKRDSFAFEAMEGLYHYKGPEDMRYGGQGLAICSQQGEEHGLLMP